jgi:S-adenosylmethionine:tRNA ribosyltransferase-isomerase
VSPAASRVRFTLPPELSATQPPETRGLERDDVRLLVADDAGVRHSRFHDLGRFLVAGDLLVVNASATLPAAVDGTRAGGAPVVVHFSMALGHSAGTDRDGESSWVVELRRTDGRPGPVPDAIAGERVALPAGAALDLVAGYPDAERKAGGRLWRALVAVEGGVQAFLTQVGRPITYGYLRGRPPLAAYQTVFATEPGSAEMPSAGRPFTAELVTRLVTAGVLMAPVVLHTGVSSPERHEPPVPEPFRVPPATARAVNWTRAAGGRVVAVGTTVTRALETVAGPAGTVAPASGWTDLVLGPDRPARVIDGLVTGMHEPAASHLSLLEAVAGTELVQRAYGAAVAHRYLWHEFGDSCLLLPARGAGRGVR